ncbi:MAG TPA: hypothetical protein VN741_09580 [Mycobacterium sp.]|jgi:hypothetical protein|nr:hypothetical protein [Mycobacterium sp.]
MTESRRHDGPSPALLAGLSIALLFGGLGVGVAIGGIMPLPYGSTTAIQHYVLTQSLALHIMAVAVFGSSVLLAIYTATVSSRLRWLGVSGAGPTVALVGGTLAAGGLALTGLLGWMMSRPEIAGETSLVRALYLLTFLIGGPGHVVALGILIAGMATGGLLPRATAWTGIVIATLCEVTMLVLAWTAVGPILPVARVAALAWLWVAGGQLPTRRDDPAAQV